MTLGIDIGGTNVKFGIIDDNYCILERRSIPTRTDASAAAIISDIIDVCLDLKKTFPYERIGIGTPGAVDSKHGICIKAANLPFRNTPIAEMITEATGVQTTLANDANCAVTGELYAGIGKQYANFIMVTLGTGVGGGIVINGQVYQGFRSGAGEIGHMVIDYAGLPCPCGQIGCWEQYASVTALIRQTKQAAEAAPDSLLASMCNQSVTGLTVFEAIQNGCDVARRVLDNYVNYILIGISSLDYIFQPEAIVLCGAVTNQGSALLDPIHKKQTTPSKIFISDLKNDAGIVGAAAVAIHTN